MEAVPPPSELTVEQAADLKCLGAGLSLAESRGDGERPLVRIYLKRLRKVDRLRNWTANAPKLSGDILYGEFMGLMNTCFDRLTPTERSRLRTLK